MSRFPQGGIHKYLVSEETFLKRHAKTSFGGEFNTLPVTRKEVTYAVQHAISLFLWRQYVAFPSKIL
jgi:hypothetical protein